MMAKARAGALGRIAARSASLGPIPGAELVPAEDRVAGWAVLIGALDAHIVEASRTQTPFTLLVLAVNDLGGVNEEVGYRAADEMLETVSARLAQVMRRRDLLIRYGNNRFAILLRACSAAQATVAAARFAHAVESKAIETTRGAVRITMRMGAAQAPEHGRDSEMLLRNAGQALRAAKGQEGTALVVYGPRLARTLEVRERQNEHGLDPITALNERRVLLARQPVVEARSRELAFYEALIRIRLADGSLLGAGQAVPLAERHGVIQLFDFRMLQLALDCLIEDPAGRMAINVSPMTLRNPESLTAFTAYLAAHPHAAERLIVEITETVAIDDPRAVRACLDALKGLGVSIAIDDFGSGHTSFRHLRNFPVDILKIDGSFVSNLTQSKEDAFFARMLIELAQHIGVSTVAEWVEDEETAQLLADWGVDYLQGEHIAPAELWEGDTLRKAAAGP